MYCSVADTKKKIKGKYLERKRRACLSLQLSFQKTILLTTAECGNSFRQLFTFCVTRHLFPTRAVKQARSAKKGGWAKRIL